MSHLSVFMSRYPGVPVTLAGEHNESNSGKPGVAGEASCRRGLEPGCEGLNRSRGEDIPGCGNGMSKGWEVDANMAYKEGRG